jgi:uncharacterized OsmC-like protein
MEQENMVNGVDVQKLKETVEAIKGDTDIAAFNFRIRNKWILGGHNQSTVTDFFGAKEIHPHLTPFTLDADEPPLLLGEDLGPNPVEYLLTALASCLTSTLVYHAALRNIKIDELEAELEGDIDVRGFLGLSKDVRKGYKNITVTFKIKTDAENLDILRELSKFSPVFDVTSNGTNVDVKIERK